MVGPYPGVMVTAPVGLLRQVQSPADLKALDPAQLPQLAAEIRAFLIENVSRTGGHLGPNLGVVELTIALHRAFDSPSDPVVSSIAGTEPNSARTSSSSPRASATWMWNRAPRSRAAAALVATASAESV